MTLYILDTDTLSLHQRGNARVGEQIVRERERNQVAITIISVEEQIAGWFTMLRRAVRPSEQLAANEHMSQSLRELSRLQIVSFTQRSLDLYLDLKKRKVNVGSNDLKIAAIVLDMGATLVTRNRRDFERIPGLRVVDWSAS